MVPHSRRGNAGMSGRALRILATAAALGLWTASGFAQQAEWSPQDLNRIIEKLERQERQAREDGFVLEHFKVEQPQNDPRRKTMKLSIGEVGDASNDNPFAEDRSIYLLDPLVPDDTPPVGLNLKLQF
jgi:hypothetical protein